MHVTAIDPTSRRHRATTALRVSALAAAVLALHVLLLAGVPSLPAKAAAVSVTSVQVRQIVRAPEAAPPAAAPQAEAESPPAVAAAAATRAAPQPQAPSQAPSKAPSQTRSPPRSEPTFAGPAAHTVPVSVAASQEDPEAPPLLLAAAASAAPARAATPAASAPAAADDDTPPPTYATRAPPATQLQYELRRGAITARGEMNWRPAGERYELQLDGHALGISILGWTSSGGFDAAGLAPQRFLDRRTGRAARAANFQRDKGLITYSSGGAEHPLLAGAQDRLSWMIQLAAIVDAEPARFGAGKKVSMLVSDARGDAGVWTFVIAGHEAVDLVGQRLPRALRASREPRKPFDTAVDVWLDPSRHHLPVRMRLASAGNGGSDSMEFVLVP